VVRARLEVTLDLDVEVDVRVTGEQVEHVVEEADAGTARPSPGPVECKPQK